MIVSILLLVLIVFNCLPTLYLRQKSNSISGRWIQQIYLKSFSYFELMSFKIWKIYICFVALEYLVGNNC